jgi:hypothetical protein
MDVPQVPQMPTAVKLHLHKKHKLKCPEYPFEKYKGFSFHEASSIKFDIDYPAFWGITTSNIYQIRIVFFHKD